MNSEQTTIGESQTANADDGMISIYIMGKEYTVPSGLTILKATEYAGYRYVRGCGCRGGVCGACATVYRTADSHRIKVGLACQTVIEPGMYLAQVPFYPANKAIYDIETMRPATEEILKLYPEIARCLCCEVCRMPSEARGHTASRPTTDDRSSTTTSLAPTGACCKPASQVSSRHLRLVTDKLPRTY